MAHFMDPSLEDFLKLVEGRWFFIGSSFSYSGLFFPLE
jgi:hypothetical protein